LQVSTAGVKESPLQGKNISGKRVGGMGSIA